MCGCILDTAKEWGDEAKSKTTTKKKKLHKKQKEMN